MNHIICFIIILIIWSYISSWYYESFICNTMLFITLLSNQSSNERHYTLVMCITTDSIVGYY